MNNSKTKIVTHKCYACGYEFSEEITHIPETMFPSISPFNFGEDNYLSKVLKGDQDFIGIIFDKGSILYGGRGRGFDAYACPKCRTIKLA